MLALNWCFSVEGYSWRQGRGKAPLEVPAAAVKSCYKINTLKGVLFRVTFEGRYINHIMVSRLPEGWDRPVDGEKTAGGLVWQSAQEYLKNIHRLSVTTTFLAVLALAVYLLLLLKRLVAAQVLSRGWFINGGCALDCAQKAVSIHFTVLLVLLSATLPLFWSLWFLHRNLSRAREFNFRRAMQAEALMLSCMSFILTFQVLARLQESKYLEFAGKQWSGTLGAGNSAAELPAAGPGGRP